MCKHVAAALYGVGARLDEKPQLLFVLRGADEGELLQGAGEGMTLAKSAPAGAKVLDEGDVAALFGLEMAEEAPTATLAPPARTGKRARASAPVVAPATRKTGERKASPAPGPKRTVRGRLR